MTKDPRSNRPFKVLYFVASYKNLTGSQRSLLSMVARLPAHVERKVGFPGQVVRWRRSLSGWPSWR